LAIELVVIPSRELAGSGLNLDELTGQALPSPPMLGGKRLKRQKTMTKFETMEPKKPPDDVQFLLLEEVTYILRIFTTSVRRLAMAGRLTQ
jgi:hypothetical protein